MTTPHDKPPRAQTSDTDIERRWPRLLRAMRWVACLSQGEAIACIRDYLNDLNYSTEAVNHFGGTRAVLETASRAQVCQTAAYLSQGKL